MKSSTTVILFAALAAILAMPCRSRAQIVKGDTMFVYATPPGNLNEVIAGDTTSTGARADSNRVYVLQQTGSADTTYFLTATLVANYNLTIIGRPNPTTGKLPVIAPFVSTDGSSPTLFFDMNPGNITLEHLYFDGWRTDSTEVTMRLVQMSADSDNLVLNHCVVEGFLQNLIHITAINDNISITNCMVKDDDSPSDVVCGICYAPGSRAIDTFKVVNNTFFAMKWSVLLDLGFVKYFDYQHNTYISGTMLPFGVPQMSNGVISNNVFYAVSSEGADSAQIAKYMLSSGTNHLGLAIITLDSLRSLTSAPYDLTENQREIVVDNNDYFWPQALYNFWNKWNQRDTIHYQSPQFMDARTAFMFSDKSAWPGLSSAKNDSVDPGFSSSIATPTIDTLISYITKMRQGLTTLGMRLTPFVDPSPLDPEAGAPADWAQTQGYPVPENLAYSNTALQTAGTDGFAMGDLNWFPKQLALWEQGKVNAVERFGSELPEVFSLSQNYPNPFNPTTDIKVSLRQSGAMSLKVYNVLGQLVDVVARGYKPAGEYTFNVNMDRFASGVYFYTLRQGANSMTKKMLLLK